MKIASIVASYWPAHQFGGTIVSVHHLNKGLVQLGNEVTVYTTNVGLERSIAAEERTVIDGVNVIYFGYEGWLEFLSPTGWQFSPSMVRALNAQLRDYDLVMVHGLWNFPMIAGAFLCRRLRVPYIWTLHGQFYPETLRRHWWKKGPFYWLIARRMLLGSSCVRFTSQHEQVNCERLLPHGVRTALVLLAIDLKDFTRTNVTVDLISKFPHLAKKRVVLFLGRLSWKKGLDILIPAFAKVASDVEDAHLLIVGGAEEGYDRTVRSLLSESGLTYVDLLGDNRAHPQDKALQARATLAGPLYDADCLAAFSIANVFMLSSYSENFAITVMEAMAAEVPIIVSENVGLAAEVREAEAGIVVSLDVDMLAAALRRILGDGQLARAMGRNGAKAIQGQLAYRELIKQMADLTVEVMSEYSRSG